jgi:Integrase core domain
VRDELLDVELFSCLAEAQVVIEDWRQDYNTNRPHSSLGMRSPAVFAAAITQATLDSATNCSWGRATQRTGSATATITPTILATPSARPAGSG